MHYIVNRDSPIPAYYQIALDLRQRITGGEWRAGHQLPSEPELSKQYAVSRMTMRQAVAELVKEGVLVRRRGHGTFVSRGYLDITERASEELAMRMGAKKASLRHQVWARLRQVAKPDSRFHWRFEEFVPDFEGSEQCAQAIREMTRYQDSKAIFVAPDNSLARVRQYAIEDQKWLLVATFGIARGFYLLEPGAVSANSAPFAATLDGMELFGRLISLPEIKALGTVDLLITGISLVTEKGVRWGKGHGYFDLEWAMFREVGVVEEDTPVIAVGHDCQVVATDLEPSAVDTIADFIVTPSRVIEVQKVFPKPKGILWQYISPELRQQVPPLQSLYAQHEGQAQT